MHRITPVAAVCLAFFALTVPGYAQTVDVTKLPGDIQPFEDQVFLPTVSGATNS